MNNIFGIQKLAKLRIYLTPYVYNELIFDGLQFMHNISFLKKNLLYNLVVHIHALLLVPFAPKLVNYLNV